MRLERGDCGRDVARLVGFLKEYERAFLKQRCQILKKPHLASLPRVHNQALLLSRTN